MSDTGIFIVILIFLALPVLLIWLYVKSKSTDHATAKSPIPVKESAPQQKPSALGKALKVIIAVVVIYFGFKYIYSDDPIKVAKTTFKGNYQIFDDQISDGQVVFSTTRGDLVQLRVSITGKTLYPLVVLNKTTASSIFGESKYEGIAIAHLGDQVASPASVDEIQMTARYYNLVP